MSDKEECASSPQASNGSRGEQTSPAYRRPTESVSKRVRVGVPVAVLVIVLIAAWLVLGRLSGAFLPVFIGSVLAYIFGLIYVLYRVLSQDLRF